MHYVVQREPGSSTAPCFVERSPRGGSKSRNLLLLISASHRGTQWTHSVCPVAPTNQPPRPPHPTFSQGLRYLLRPSLIADSLALASVSLWSSVPYFTFPVKASFDAGTPPGGEQPCQVEEPVTPSTVAVSVTVQAVLRGYSISGLLEEGRWIYGADQRVDFGIPIRNQLF